MRLPNMRDWWGSRVFRATTPSRRGLRQRHFIIEAPGGVLIDVIEPIEPSPEFAAAYA